VPGRRAARWSWWLAPTAAASKAPCSRRQALQRSDRDAGAGRKRRRRQSFQNRGHRPVRRFTLRGISPGEYKLYAWEEIEQGAYEDPEFLRPYEKKGKDVRVDEASKTTLELTLIPAGEPR
jgi:hypothetical protein